MDIGADGSVTVLTGPQASGKSTVAKAVYFFRTVKDELKMFLYMGPAPRETLREPLIRHLLYKLNMLYGWDFSLYDTMSLEYYYEKGNSQTAIKITAGDTDNRLHGNLTMSFGCEFDYLLDGDAGFYESVKGNLSMVFDVLAKTFRDEHSAIFVPAGRSSLVSLSDHIQHLFSEEGWRRHVVDYCVWKFIQLTVELRPWFSFARAMHEPYFHRQHILECINYLTQKTINSSYQYVDNEERLYFAPHDATKQSKHVKIANASSGQQEAVWVFNTLTHYLAEQKKVFLIIEEPEAHLYPESQMHMTDALALFAGYGNSVMITTHSPYVLGEINNLLIWGQVPESKREQATDVIFEKGAITPDKITAQHIVNGECKKALDDEGLCLIMNELIDGASDIINGRCDKLLGLLDNEDES